MHGSSGSTSPDLGSAFRTVHDVPELRAVIAALGEEFEKPLETIREVIGGLSADATLPTVVQPHLATARAMCDDVAVLTQRYLDYIEQVQALPAARPRTVRLDALLVEIDQQVMPEAFGRGVAWNCALEGPIRPVSTDGSLCLEAFLEWAALAVESARPGDSVSLVLTVDSEPRRSASRLRLVSSAEEVIAHLSSLREDPLFSRLVCLEEIGTDVGSRLALCLERMALLGIDVRFDAPDGGMVRAIEFQFPDATAMVRS